MDEQDLQAWSGAKERPDPDRVKFILDHATPVTLDLPADLPFADWQAIIASLKNMGRSMAWWIGDCLYYGENNYGEQYTKALDELVDYYSPGTLHDAKWVSKVFPPKERHHKLSWTHHRALAAVKSDQERFALLEKADQKGWTVERLKQEVSGKKGDDDKTKGKKKRAKPKDAVDKVAALLSGNVKGLRNGLESIHKVASSRNLNQITDHLSGSLHDDPDARQSVLAIHHLLKLIDPDFLQHLNEKIGKLYRQIQEAHPDEVAEEIAEAA
jgi:hypothetical protein